MNFNKIEMQGFKSFADKTKIQFDSDVTAIVGPNGCGKSNVADAIRWVLGEQSAKTLRGKSMQDVIFNGTENRRSTSYCEVSLFFDNKEKLFGIDYDELVLTRKLDRSGDSEYSINRNVCRLKDIVDLLRDTGVGREGYSIIGQGRIDEILSAKPDDRRNIFEEAAGIAKSKSKKLEAERKLLRTRDNLSRHQDIMGELEKQLEPLKRQSEDARKASELKEELKLNEVNAYIYQYENNAREKEIIDNRLKEIGGALAVERAAYNDIAAAFNERLEGIGKADSEIAELRDTLTACLVEAEKNAGELKLRDQRISGLKSEIDRIDGDIGVLNTEIQAKGRDVAACQAEIESLNGQIEYKEALLARAGAELDGLKLSLSDREGRIEQSNKSIIENMDKLSDIKSNMSKLLKEEELLKEKKDGISLKIEELKDTLFSLEQIKSAFDAESARLKGEIDGGVIFLINSNRELADRENRIDRAREECRAVGQRIAALETKSKMLEDIKNQYEGYNYPVKKLMTDGKNDKRLAERNLGVLAELIKVDQKYEQAIDVALGAALQNIVVRDEDDAKYLIEYLKERKYGRATFLPLTSVRPRLLEREYEGVLGVPGCFGVASELISYDKRYQGIIRNLLGRTVIVDTVDTAIKTAKKYNYAFRIVTLEGDVFMTSGAITGGSRKSDSNAEIIGRDRTIAETKESLKEQTTRFETLDKAVKAAVTELDKLKAAALDRESVQKKNEVSFAALNERLDKTAAELGAASKEKQSLEAQASTVSNRIDEIRLKIDSVDRLEDEIKDERKNIDGLREESLSEVGQKRLEREMLEESITKAKILLSQMRKDLDTGAALTARLNQERAAAAVRILALEGNRKKAEDALAEERSKAISDAMSDEQRERIEGLKERLACLDSDKTVHQRELAALEDRRNLKAEEISALNEKKIREESALERLDTDSKLLAAKVAEEYGLDYEAAQVYRADEYDYQKSLTAINRLKRKINDLGPVNMLAVDEFAEVGGRYENMTLQREDMLKAEADLLKIIGDLTGEMHTKFKTEFDKINENFMVIFKQLFNGGKAKLQLEESDDKDILNAGIEIYAEPPGKKLQHISLLSGGEKALTAIAILFAILKLKPMPFCVLDEIEAALDDANANLFAEYLRKFSKNTQFIVITHRKPTMELADTLYGVTMEEKGVSKLVSVQLSDAVKHVKAAQ